MWKNKRKGLLVAGEGVRRPSEHSQGTLEQSKESPNAYKKPCNELDSFRCVLYPYAVEIGPSTLPVAPKRRQHSIFLFSLIYNKVIHKYSLHSSWYGIKVNCLCQHFLAYVLLCLYCWNMGFTWKRKCQCGSVKCEWSSAEINRDFLLIYSRMLFFIEQDTYFSYIPLRLQQYILHRDDEGQIVKQPDFTEGPTETPALLLALADVVMNAKPMPRHLTKLSLSSASLLSSHC